MMNQRIRELTLRAELIADAESSLHKTGYSREEIFHQRFAELIVRECAEIAKKEQEFNNQYSQDMVNIDQCILIEFGL